MHQLDRAFGEGENPRRDRQLDALVAMRLLDRDAFLPRQPRATERHAAIDADRHQANAPVPSGVAGGLAHKVHVIAGEAVRLIIERERDGERMGVRPRLRDVLGDGEFQTQGVLARAHLAGDVDVVAHELVLGASDLFAIEEDRREAVDIFKGEREVAINILARRGKAAFHRPRNFVDPHHRLLVVGEIRIGNLAGSEERCVHIARQDNARPDVSCGTCESILAAEIELGRGGCGYGGDHVSSQWSQV